METEFDEKGKIFTDLVKKITFRARLQTTTHLIVGDLHVRRDSRLKDELDVQEPFLPVTDATVYAKDGQELFSSAFLAVQRAQIVWVMAVDDEQKGQPA